MRLLLSTLLLLTGCGTSLTDPCSYLPSGNEETIEAAIDDIRARGYERWEVQAVLINELSGFDNTRQMTECMNAIMDEVYGPY